MHVTVVVALGTSDIALCSARDLTRPSVEETASLRGSHAGEGMDNTGLTLFWLFVGLTVASIMCSLVVVFFRRCILSLLPPRPSALVSSTSTSRATAPRMTRESDIADAGKEKSSTSPTDSIEAVEVQQPGGSVVIGVRLA